MLVQKVIRRDFVVLHGFIGGPVILCSVGLSLLDRRVDIFINDREGRSAEKLYHAFHHLIGLDSDDQAFHVLDSIDRVLEIEVADACVIPGQRNKAGVFEGRSDLSAELSVQYSLHVVSIPVEIRQHQKVSHIAVRTHGGHGAADKIDSSETELLERGLLISELGVCVDPDLDASLRALVYELGKSKG